MLVEKKTFAYTVPIGDYNHLQCVHNMFTPGLSLEFSCIEFVIQSVVILWLVDAKIRASDKELPVRGAF